MNGRHEDPTIVRCHCCKWIGTVASCIHSYKTGFACGQVLETEPADFCPSCGSEELENMERAPTALRLIVQRCR